MISSNRPGTAHRVFSPLKHKCLTFVASAILFSTLFCLPASCLAGPPNLLNLFGKRSVSADPDADYQLVDSHGPWMIQAANFAGVNAEQEAKQLTLELRAEFNLPAWIYKTDFDFSGDPGVGTLNGHRMRYRNKKRFSAYAVLVGEYDRIDHPQLQKDLKRIKTMQPQAMQTVAKSKEAEESDPMAVIRRMRDWAGSNLTERKGPMVKAFATRNPMLKTDYFSRPEVDSFVRKMNEGVPHSLLDADGNYTVVVKTFAGLSPLSGAQKKFLGGSDETTMDNSVKRLDEYAADADAMVSILRE
ncbi:MAG: hypothetical protein AAFP90_07595, partial [Planctomycetota bacterium]